MKAMYAAWWDGFLDDGGAPDANGRNLGRYWYVAEDSAQILATEALLEGRHRESGVLELLPVELGRLLRARPDDRLARVVDLVGEPVPLLERHPGDHVRERLGDVVEGVVIVVEDDHDPVTAKGLVRAR